MKVFFTKINIMMFFIRNDLIKNQKVPIFEDFRDTQYFIHRPCQNKREEILLDYEHFFKT